MNELPNDAPTMNVDEMSNDINDKNKTRTYLKPSQDWHIGHGLNE